ncbi:MAG TPA: L,D-transpeptidase family protein [Mucilaginibacter sp.]|jgi:murein L,D-transpeptidase YcbB/YkuD
MTKFISVKKIILPVLILVLSVAVLTFQSCKKKRSALANVLYKKTHNKVFKDFDSEGFSEVFKTVLDSEKTKVSHRDVIAAYYKQDDYVPEFIIKHLFNNDLLTAVTYFEKADEHGLDSSIFQPGEIKGLVNKFKTKNGIKTIDEAYYDMAKLEIVVSNSLINYSDALQYGVVNPKKIFKRYFMATRQPDTASMVHVFHISNMKAYLDSVQPKNPQYYVLQKAFLSGMQAPGKTQEETKRILLVNMERLRWRNKPYQDKYVIVNIPDYFLNVIDSGRSVLEMKVCVGEGRNKTNSNTLLSYNDTAKEDKPYPKETPILNSMIHSVEVNPVWNIPQSIANKEIIVQAAKDKYYLENKGINVYKNDKLVADPEDINWSKVTRENSDYEFKQKPGDDNSLGKIKFLFNNESSVYLHDTPAKSAFYKKDRDVSHGCVRLGDPQGLALNLFGEGDKYTTIAKDMSEDNPEPTTIYLPKRVPVYITYATCWVDESGTLQFRQDVYGLDIVLYDHMLKFTNPQTGLIAQNNR